MVKKIGKILSVLLLAGVFFIMAGSVKAEIDTEFNPNYIISDEEVLDYTSMNLDDIKAFLKDKAGFLATYSCANPDGKMMTAAEIIYDRAVANKVNPKFILVLLQKEMSLIDDVSPKQSQLDWAAGYGCPDGDACNARWKGFWKQVNSASLQFRDYMDNPQLYTYKVGGSYVFANYYSTLQKGSITVKPLSQATAALYNYTPHVYNGNYNFWKIWKRWFAKTYPDGTLLQGKGEKEVWLIQGGKKRQFSSKGVLISRFNINKIITVDPKDLSGYDKGAAINFPQYSLVQSPKGTIFLLVDDKKHGIASMQAFRKIGFNMVEVEKASWDDLNAYKNGAILTATSTYPVGALLQNNKTGGVYWVINNTRAPIIDKIFLSTKFKNRKIKAVAPKELDKYATTTPVLFDDGELLRPSVGAGVYVITNKEKRLFSSDELFEALNYRWDNIITVSQKVLDLYPTGLSVVDLRKTYDESAATGTPAISTSTPFDLSASSTPLLISTTTEILSTSTILDANILDTDIFDNVPTGTIISASSTR